MKKLFIFLFTLICVPSVSAYESYITSGGYKAMLNVEVNWGYIEQLSATHVTASNNVTATAFSGSTNDLSNIKV